MKETIKQMIQRVNNDPIKNHCSKHGIISEWINGKCADCEHKKLHGNNHGLHDCPLYPQILKN